MRPGIKLLNICMRHKCSKVPYEEFGEPLPKFNKKLVRIKKWNHVETRRTDVTSNTNLKQKTTNQIKVHDEPTKSTYDQRKTDVETRASSINSNATRKSVHEQKSMSDAELKNIWQSIASVNLLDDNVQNSKNKQCIKEEDSEINAVPKESNPIDFKDSKDAEFRVNELNMQMLSKKLYEQLFGYCHEHITHSPKQLSQMKEELKEFGIDIDCVTRLPDVNIDLPPLEGHSVEEHFFNIATAQTKPYLKIIRGIIKDVPEMPKEWLLQEGWTRYTKDKVESVDYPLEEGIVFDVEVCMSEGPLPTLATAVSNEAWYGWVSKSVMDGPGMSVQSLGYTTDMLIPMESTHEQYGQKLNDHQKKPKIVVGHNVSFDRTRIKEQYWMNCTGTRFIDTMSLHVSISGVNSYQRAILKSDQKQYEAEQWRSNASLNSLVEVYKLYCGKEIDKKSKDVFVEGSLNDVRERFNELMMYCAGDVKATHAVLQQLFPMFHERFPQPVTLAGILELGLAYLPVNSNWQRYIEESESTYEDLNYEAKCSLSKRADQVCKLMHNEKYKEDLWMWDQDWSIRDVKMKLKLSKAQNQEMEAERKQREALRGQSDFEKYLTDGEDEVDSLEDKFSYLHDTKHFLPAKLPHMPGYPAWYRKLCLKESDENWVPGPQNLSTSMQITPKLLNLTWENYPLHYMRDHGWGFLVPYSNNLDVETKLPLKQLLEQCPVSNLTKSNDDVEYAMASLNKDVESDLHKIEFWRHKKEKKSDSEKASGYKGSGIWCNVDIDNCCWFFKLPHKDGSSHKVGNPLAKDFLNKFSENVLAGLDESAAQVLKIAKMVSYWRNNRDRILSQIVIWVDDKDLPTIPKKSKERGRTRYGAIIPQVVVSGTLTRRAVEPTWMTASNARSDRVGSELRAMIQAPPGYSIVGADVDSQELWIASAIGDSYHAKMHGATPFGWMTLIGTKSNGSDMHSVTAKAVGISRDHAKIINYARIYGAGQKFAERLLKQFNPSMTESEAISKSRKMFAMTKGKRMYKLKSEEINPDLEDRYYSSYEAFKIAKAYAKTVQEMFDKGRWVGGSESAMFNRLEEIAGSPKPVTPFLESRLSRALERNEDNVDDEKYLPTKVNWVVQSGAVDFLHLMLVCMRWLMRDNARFCLSFHDEVRYLVPSRYKYNAALAMHVTNLLTRSFCASRLGMKDLPMSVAFFASVEVDTVLRKESSHDCKTPSNPHGLENGYEVPPGECLDIWKALEKSSGSLGPWHRIKHKGRSSSTSSATAPESAKYSN